MSQLEKWKEFMGSITIDYLENNNLMGESHGNRENLLSTNSSWITYRTEHLWLDIFTPRSMRLPTLTAKDDALLSEWYDTSILDDYIRIKTL